MGYNLGSTRLTESRKPFITADEETRYQNAKARGNSSVRRQICQLADTRRIDGNVMRPATGKSAAPRIPAKTADVGKQLASIGAAFQKLGEELQAISKIT